MDNRKLETALSTMRGKNKSAIQQAQTFLVGSEVIVIHVKAMKRAIKWLKFLSKALWASQCHGGETKALKDLLDLREEIKKGHACKPSGHLLSKT